MYHYNKNVISETTCRIVITTFSEKKEHKTKIVLCRRKQNSLPSFKFSSNFDIQLGSLNIFVFKIRQSTMRFYQDFRGQDLQLLSKVMCRMA